MIKKRCKREILYYFYRNNLPDNYTKNDTLEFLKRLRDEINKYKYSVSFNFITIGRRDFLREGLTKKLKFDFDDQKIKFQESLGNIESYIYGEDSFHWLHHEYTKKKFEHLLKINAKYRDKGIICLQEKNILLDMINEMEGYINEHYDEFI